MTIHETKPRSPFAGCLLITLASVLGASVCSGAAGWAVNRQCVQDGQRWLVDYPGATVESSTYSFRSMWGIGNSERRLTTPDDVNTVRAWYLEHESALNRDGYERAGRFLQQGRRLAATDDGGTQIVLTGECVPTWDLSAFVGGGGTTTEGE